jgi:hypothetical protein
VTLTAALIGAALLPALAGVILLGSVLAGRPLVSPYGVVTSREGGSRGVTLVWSVGLLAAGALQGMSELVGNMSMTDPRGMALRTLIGLGAEAILLIGTAAWRRRLTVRAA